MKIDVGWAYSRLTELQPEYDLYYNYYKGKQDSYMGEIKTMPRLNDLLKTTKTNLIRPIVETLVSELEIQNISSESETANEFITDYFSSNRLSSMTKSLWRDITVFGSGYLSLWFDNNKELKIYRKNPQNTIVHYDCDNNIDQALSYTNYKDLEGMPHCRIYLYTADKIYISNQKGSFHGGLISFNEEYDNPLKRVPIFHFSYGTDGTFNDSELSDLIPLQRNINALMQQRTIAGELSAHRQKYATGITPVIDPVTKEQVSPFKADISKMWISTKSDAKFGEFSATDLENFTKAINSIQQQMLVISRIPSFIFNLDASFPSGTALRVAQAPLISKISDKQAIFGDIMEDIFSCILDYNNIQGYGVLNAIWKDNFVYDEKELIEASANKIALGVKSDVVLRELGYNAEDLTIEY